MRLQVFLLANMAIVGLEDACLSFTCCAGLNHEKIKELVRIEAAEFLESYLGK